ncbi:hypothetical protein GL263_27395, partial [Streptomyces durbertensis]|nr:hypothetical protein [Streptomyces durbertensis]
MTRVKRLIKHANPLPAPQPLSVRAAAELETLVGPAASSPAPPRRRLLVAAVASCAALAAGAAALLALHNGPTPPPGGSSATSPGLADEPYYSSPAELEGAADLIVRARLVNEREGRDVDLPVTVATAKVLATARGSAPTDPIELTYTCL